VSRNDAIPDHPVPDGREALHAMGAMERVAGDFDWFETPSIPFAADALEHSIAGRFQAVAALQPDRTAILLPEREITYGALEATSNVLAASLLGRIDPGTPVAVGTRDPVLHIVAVLGVLKAGGLYTAISDHLPTDRQRLILDLVAPALFLATSSEEATRHADVEGLSIERVEELSAQSVAKLSAPEPFAPEPFAPEPFAPEPLVVEPFAARPPADACYVLFTSGSTGTPKGAVQSQRNVLRNCRWHVETMRLSPDDRMTQLYSAGTMGAVRATWNALLSGAVLCPYAVGEGELSRLFAWMKRTRPSVFHCAASLFRTLTKGFERDRDLVAGVRLLILGGEAVVRRDFDAFAKLFPERSLMSTGLGATETTTVRSMLLPPSAEPATFEDRLPLGFAVPGLEMHLKDPVSRQDGSVLGEIRIESRDLFFGYWPDAPLSDPGGVRAYDTGDLALCRADGVVFHAGRRDHEVKIRGNRVNLLEIERVVRSADGVQDCVVFTLMDDAGDPLIVLTIDALDRTAVTSHRIRYLLSKHLPAYMVPSMINFVEALPRGSGGKVKLGVLREAVQQNRRFRGEDPFARHRAMLSGAGRLLMQCLDETSHRFFRRWAETKGANAGIFVANFRDMDIDSLSALEVCLNIERYFGVSLSEETLLGFHRFAQLQEYLEAHADQDSVGGKAGKSNRNAVRFAHFQFGSRATPKQIQALRDGAPVPDDLPTDAQHWPRFLAETGALMDAAGKSVPEPYAAEPAPHGSVLYTSAGASPSLKTLIMAMPGFADRLMLPISTVLQHLDAQQADLLVVPLKTWMEEVMQARAEDAEAPAAYPVLMERMTALSRHYSSYRSQALFGTSYGALPAVLMACEVGASHALCAGPGSPFDRAWRDTLGIDPVARLGNFAAGWKTEGGGVRTSVLVGQGAVSDQAHARELRGLIGSRTLVVKSVPSDKVGHLCLAPLVRRRQFSAVLAEALGLEPA